MLEGSEDSIEVMRIPLGQAIELVMDGVIKANGSAHAILKAARMIGI